MIAHRRIYPAMAVELTTVEHLFIQIGAHTVQTLVLEVLALSGQLIDRGDGMRVVRGKLRVERIAQIQQATGTGQVGNVGIGLAGKNRVVGMTLNLRELDLGIPVSALDQPDRDPVAGGAGQLGQPVDGRPAAPQISLQGNTETVPTGQLVVCQYRGKHVELEHQPRGFLGIHGQRDARLARPDGQFGQNRHQLLHDALALRHFIARMQR